MVASFIISHRRTKAWVMHLGVYFAWGPDVGALLVPFSLILGGNCPYFDFVHKY